MTHPPPPSPFPQFKDTLDAGGSMVRQLLMGAGPPSFLFTALNPYLFLLLPLCSASSLAGCCCCGMACVDVGGVRALPFSSQFPLFLFHTRIISARPPLFCPSGKTTVVSPMLCLLCGDKKHLLIQASQPSLCWGNSLGGVLGAVACRPPHFMEKVLAKSV